MTARDIHYGRRGGGWATSGAGTLAGQVSRLLKTWRDGGGTLPDQTSLFHPDTIATSRAHAASPHCPAHRTKNPGVCRCSPDPDDLAAVWAGRYRMARARRAAGRPLDPTDLEAIARHEPPGP